MDFALRRRIHCKIECRSAIESTYLKQVGPVSAIGSKCREYSELTDPDISIFFLVLPEANSALRTGRCVRCKKRPGFPLNCLENFCQRRAIPERGR
jgi:hypothetical protein